MMKGEKPSRKPGLQKGRKGGAAQRREDQETVKYKGGYMAGIHEDLLPRTTPDGTGCSVRTRNRTTQIALAIYYNDRAGPSTHTHLQ